MARLKTLLETQKWSQRESTPDVQNTVDNNRRYTKDTAVVNKNGNILGSRSYSDMQNKRK